MTNKGNVKLSLIFSPSDLFFFSDSSIHDPDFFGNSWAGPYAHDSVAGYRGGCHPHTPTSEECHRPRQEAPAADREKTPGRRTTVVIKRGSICPFFKNLPPKKRSSYSRFLAFLGTGWVKAGVKIFLDFKAIGGPYLTSKSGEFRQTGPIIGLFSTRTKKKRFTGVLCKGQNRKK